MTAAWRVALCLALKGPSPNLARSMLAKQKVANQPPDMARSAPKVRLPSRRVQKNQVKHARVVVEADSFARSIYTVFSFEDLSRRQNS
jgi:hypothetical protein